MLLAVRISSYGEARVALGCRPRAGLRFFRALQTSRVHPQLDISTAKSMNQFFYNLATTTWPLKHVLFLINYN